MGTCSQLEILEAVVRLVSIEMMDGLAIR